MKIALKIETLHASFDKSYHILVMGVPAVGMSDEPSMQDIGTVRSLAWEKSGPLGRLGGRWAHRLST